MARPISDHLPCVIKIGTNIPKTRVVRFENFWLQHSTFKEVVVVAWNIPVGNLDAAKIINADKEKDGVECLGNRCQLLI